MTPLQSKLVERLLSKKLAAHVLLITTLIGEEQWILATITGCVYVIAQTFLDYQTARIGSDPSLEPGHRPRPRTRARRSSSG